MSKLLTIIANVYNGEFITPRSFDFPCESAIPIGESLIRNFDQNACIVVKKVFLVQVGETTFGSTQFKTLDDFNSFKNNQCKCCPEPCFIVYNGCNLTYNGCYLTYGSQ